MSVVDNKRKVTVYEKLEALNNEISAGIKQISSNNPSQIEEELARIRQASYRERAPEAEFATQLFRKYVSTVRSDGGESQPSKHDNDDNQGISFELPSYAFEANGTQIAGVKDAIQRNIFWYRSITVMFGFIAMVIFASSRYISDPYLRPNKAFNYEDTTWCNPSSIRGEFDMRPFQATLGISILIFIHSVVMCIYYLLPINAEENKYIPGLEALFAQCATSESVHSTSTRVCSWITLRSKTFEMIADILLFICNLLITLIASISVEKSVQFSVSYPYTSNLSETVYFTIDTFFSTYSHKSPPCSEGTPSTALRAGVAMLYIALFFMALTVQVSIKSYRKEQIIRLGLPTELPTDGLPTSQSRYTIDDQQNSSDRTSQKSRRSANELRRPSTSNRPGQRKSSQDNGTAGLIHAHDSEQVNPFDDDEGEPISL